MLNKLELARMKLESEGKKIFNLSSGSLVDLGLEFPLQFPAKIPPYKPEPKGNTAARAAIVEFYSMRGITFDPENIFLTSGTSESYLHLFKLLCEPGDEILFPNPSYPLFDHLAALANIQLKHYELDSQNEWQINLEDLFAKISPKTRAIVLISPNNPTGGVLTTDTLNEVRALAEKHSLPIISDEVFSEFIYDGKNFPRITSTRVPIFTLNGISKTYALPGLKLSWILADNFPNLEALELSIDTLLAANQISQALLPEIIKNGEAFITQTRARLEQSRNTVIQILSQSPNISFVKPAGGFHLFAEIKNFQGTDEEFALQLLQKTSIFVHPGYFYDYEKELRVLISFAAAPDELKSQLKILLKNIDK